MSTTDDGEWYLDDSPMPLTDLLFGGELDVDEKAQSLFIEAFFSSGEADTTDTGMHIKDSQAYIDLVDYLWDVYGIDFSDAFSWEDFREWYDANYEPR